MKKVLLLVAIAAIFSARVSNAQSSVDSLKKYCAIDYPSFNYILRNAGSGYTPDITMSQYKENDSHGTFVVEMAMYNNFAHPNIPLENAVNDLWKLISKQLDGANGPLTTKIGTNNLFPVMNTKSEANLIVVVWNPNKKHWIIGSTPLMGVRMVYKGSRMFAVNTARK